MVFQVVHTHTNESCPAQSTEQAKRLGEWWQSVKKTSGIKVLAGYVSPIDHTFYIILDADDFQTVARSLGALNTYGTGRIIPVLTLDQTTPMAEAGAFRVSK